MKQVSISSTKEPVSKLRLKNKFYVCIGQKPDVQRRAMPLSEVQKVTDNRKGSLWVRCPICGGKTRTKVYEDTVLVKFPLYCPKCKKEIRIDVVKLKMVLSK